VDDTDSQDHPVVGAAHFGFDHRKIHSLRNFLAVGGTSVPHNIIGPYLPARIAGVNSPFPHETAKAIVNFNGNIISCVLLPGRTGQLPGRDSHPPVETHYSLHIKTPPLRTQFTKCAKNRYSLNDTHVKIAPWLNSFPKEE